MRFFFGVSSVEKKISMRHVLPVPGRGVSTMTDRRDAYQRLRGDTGLLAPSPRLQLDEQEAREGKPWLLLALSPASKSGKVIISLNTSMSGRTLRGFGDGRTGFTRWLTLVSEFMVPDHTGLE